MLSRAHLLIERDHERLVKDSPWGIEAVPLHEDNLFEWSVKLLGLKDTQWDGGIFRLYVKFDEYYNGRPPEICFHTIPFHPNVDMITGRPCIDFLDDWSQWKDGYTFSTLLLAVQTMLSNPVLENAVNIEAARMYEISPHAYQQMVSECIAASQKLEVGLDPHVTPTTMQESSHMTVRFGVPVKHRNATTSESTGGTKVAHVSFDEYHKTWSGIATSKPKQDSKNPLLEAIKDEKLMEQVHYGIAVEELQAQVEQQLQEHNSLIYGKFKSQPVPEDTKNAKLDKLNKMKKIYLQPRSPRKTPTMTTSPTIHAASDTAGNAKTEEHDEWEEQVEDLVSWSQKLDADLL